MTIPIRDLVDQAREAYRQTVDGMVTANEEVLNREYERELDAERYERHGPASPPGFLPCVNCGAEVRMDRDACVLCGGELR